MGAIIFFIIFVIAEMMNFFCKNSWKACCRCCFDKSKHDTTVLNNFGNNFYKELAVEDLRAEYKKTKTEMGDIKQMA